MDHPNPVLPSHDHTQPTQAGSHRVTPTSNWASWSLRILVSPPPSLAYKIPIAMKIPTCHSIIVLGKLAKHLFPATHTLPHVPNAGDVFYIVGVMLGIILWGFAIVWFIVAVIMIATTGGFPFNMGWWGFIFPVGVFTLLTISIGEELESRFFKVLSCVR